MNSSTVLWVLALACSVEDCHCHAQRLAKAGA